MSSNSLMRAARWSLLAAPFAVAFSCKVENKDDYTFTDEPRDESGGSSGRGGSAGRGGDAGKGGMPPVGSSGKGGTGAAAGEDAGGDGGTGGSSGGTGGKGGGKGGKGSGGNAGEAGAEPQGGEGGMVIVDPTPCDPNPCIHGFCTEDGDGYVCDCELGYEGARCQTNIDDCEAEPCQNEGVCTDQLDDYDCDCTGTGYVGSNCQIRENGCETDPCDHGTCVQGAGASFTCDCSNTGWEGQYCENDVDDCVVNPCLNNGRCVDTGTTSYACDCRGTYYEGQLCESALCGNGTLDPDEETDSTRSGSAEAPVNPLTCRYDFSGLNQLYCSGTCGWWGDKVDNCSQADADAFCRLKLDNQAATAAERGWEVVIATMEPGICCSPVGSGLPPEQLGCTNLGNFANRGVDVTVSTNGNLNASHGRGEVITNVTCVVER